MNGPNHTWADDYPVRLRSGRTVADLVDFVIEQLLANTAADAIVRELGAGFSLPCEAKLAIYAPDDERRDLCVS